MEFTTFLKRILTPKPGKIKKFLQIRHMIVEKNDKQESVWLYFIFKHQIRFHPVDIILNQQLVNPNQ